jgi:hypothetical protein
MGLSNGFETSFCLSQNAGFREMDVSMADKDSCALVVGHCIPDAARRPVNGWNTNRPTPFYAILFLCAGGIVPIQNKFLKPNFYQ